MAIARFSSWGRGKPLIPGYRAYLAAGGAGEDPRPAHPELWPIPEPLHHLSDGDIIRISPRSGELWVMYRRQSASNSHAADGAVQQLLRHVLAAPEAGR